MNFRGFWIVTLVLSAFFFGCSSDPNPKNTDYLRTPADFKADTANANHEFCNTSPDAFKSIADCQNTQKFILSWYRPEDAVDFQGYRIYIDTIPPNTNQTNTWASVRAQANLASVIVTNITAKDSLIFVFGKSDPLTASTSFKQDTLASGNKRIFILDSTLRESVEDGKMVFALVPIYGGQGIPGQPKTSWFITNDKFPPNLFTPKVKAEARQITIVWERPRDATSFFNSALDTGDIKNYGLELRLEGEANFDRKSAFKPTIKFFRGNTEITKNVHDSIVADKESLPLGHIYYLPDSGHAHKTKPSAVDSLTAVIGNLTPSDKLSVKLWAVDSSGNPNFGAAEKIVVHLTDTTQPSKPKFIIDSSFQHKNAFIVKWQASTDTVLDTTTKKLVEAPSPNYFIAAYRLQRKLLRKSGEKSSNLDLLDTLVQITQTSSGNVTQKIFIDTMRSLPPGRSYFFQINSIDSSGFESLTDTLTLTTDSVQFVGNDTGLQCPPGFLPIPRGTFVLGDPKSSNQDETSPRNSINMAPYCIEPYEHRDSVGQFINNVSWLQADSICKNLPMDTNIYSPQLCSEAEWERACEGPTIGSDSALLHGIQSEFKNPSILQSSCNQGTNDSEMAKSFDLRNGTCLTREGVYDLAGNYSEWVRDPYVASAYGSPQYTDSLNHNFSYVDTSKVKVRGFRGGNYLKPPNYPISSIQSLARCSNRDYAAQIRPQFKMECIDSIKPRIALIYGAGAAGYTCMELPAQMEASKITDLIADPANNPSDSTKKLRLFAFKTGSSYPDTILINLTDTTFKGKKPIGAKLTTRSLAAVVFEKPGYPPIPDTLDAKEMKDTSQTNLAKIFARETGHSGYSVQKSGGKFAIQYLYAYTTLGTKPALDSYTSHAIAFRCCTRAVRPLKTDSTLSAMGMAKPALKPSAGH